MINKLLRHITQHTANNRNLLNSVNINLKQQFKIIHNHLILTNYGFGFPHVFYEIGEKLLHTWIEILIDTHDDLTKNGEQDFKNQLSDYYRKEADIIFDNSKNKDKLLANLLCPLGNNVNYNNIITQFNFIDLLKFRK